MIFILIKEIEHTENFAVRTGFCYV